MWFLRNHLSEKKWPFRLHLIDCCVVFLDINGIHLDNGLSG